MLFFCISAIEKVRRLPAKDLANLGLVVLIVIVAVFIVKQAARMNRFVLFMIVLVTVMVVCFTWVYQRNEPRFLTPLIDGIAPFLPHK